LPHAIKIADLWRRCVGRHIAAVQCECGRSR